MLLLYIFSKLNATLLIEIFFLIFFFFLWSMNININIHKMSWLYFTTVSLNKLLTHALWAHRWRLVSLKSKDMVKRPFGPHSQTKKRKKKEKAIWALAMFWNTLRLIYDSCSCKWTKPIMNNLVWLEKKLVHICLFINKPNLSLSFRFV